MPDASGPPFDDRPMPPQWGEAFAALPLESPEPQAWQRLRARLPASAAASTRRRWPLWLAAAASLALAAIVPLRMLPESPHHASNGQPPATLAEPSSPPATAASPLQPAGVTQAPDRIAATSLSPAAAGKQAAANPRAASDPARGIVDALPPLPHDGDVAATTATSGAGAHDAADTLQAERTLAPLYAESARLEALLALARDDRVASAGIASLAVDLDAELAGIDAALTLPGLPGSRRAELWRQRVDALRQLAGIETTQRLMQARGETYDAALVSID